VAISSQSKTSTLSSIQLSYCKDHSTAAEATHPNDVNNANAQNNKIPHPKNRRIVASTLLSLLNGIKLFTFRFCFIWSF
jgi:hypothetical protein